MENIVICIINLLSFVIGAKIGQMCAKNEKVQLNPITAIKNDIESTRIKRKEDVRKQQIDTMLHNIDIYDGSGLGQKEIPK